MLLLFALSFFFFNDPPTPEIYPLPLHDALPISIPAEDHQHVGERGEVLLGIGGGFPNELGGGGIEQRVLAPSPQPGEELLQEGLGIGRLRFDEDRQSTRLNSSHSQISYAVFCLK